MRSVVLMLIVLMAGLIGFGTVIVTYANGTRHAFIQPTPTPIVSRVPTSQPTVAAPQPQIQQTIFSQGNSDLPEIALTFDDGPDPTYTPQVLSILEQYNVHATFFCVGDHVQDSPALVQQEYAAGHIVANHSWNHPDLTTLPADEMHTQLSITSDAIEQATGVRPSFFRPPYGAYNEQTFVQANALGLTSVTWNVDPDDWQEPGSSVIVDRVVDGADNGAIILLHDGGGNRTQTIAALPKILSRLQERGFRFVTLQQMIDDAKG